MRAMRFRLLVSRKKLFDAVQLAVNNHNKKQVFAEHHKRQLQIVIFQYGLESEAD